MGGGSSGTGMLWWSEKAVSFKINRKSEAASVVKSSISSKLPDFLSDYSDEVLAVNDFNTLASFLKNKNRNKKLNKSVQFQCFIYFFFLQTGIYNSACLQRKGSISGEG